MLGRAIVDGASLSHAGHGRIGAGATGALVQIELIAGIVDAGPKCARAFRRRQVSPATCPRVPLRDSVLSGSRVFVFNLSN